MSVYLSISIGLSPKCLTSFGGSSCWIFVTFQADKLIWRERTSGDDNFGSTKESSVHLDVRLARHVGLHDKVHPVQARIGLARLLLASKPCRANYKSQSRSTV